MDFDATGDAIIINSYLLESFYENDFQALLHGNKSIIFCKYVL